MTEPARVNTPDREVPAAAAAAKDIFLFSLQSFAVSQVLMPIMVFFSYLFLLIILLPAAALAELVPFIRETIQFLTQSSWLSGAIFFMPMLVGPFIIGWGTSTVLKLPSISLIRWLPISAPFFLFLMLSTTWGPIRWEIQGDQGSWSYAVPLFMALVYFMFCLAFMIKSERLKPGRWRLASLVILLLLLHLCGLEEYGVWYADGLRKIFMK